MKNLLKRLLLAVIALPILYLIIMKFTFFNHLILMIITFIASFIGSYELYRIFKDDEKPYMHFTMPTLIAIGSYFSVCYKINVIYMVLLAFSFFMFATLKAVIGEDDFKTTIARTSNTLFFFAYPLIGILALCVYMFKPQANYLIILLFSSVFANDSFAYFVGRLFGKNNKGYFKASPNKSIAGFVGGWVFTVATVFLINYFFNISFPYYQSIIIGTCLSFSANLGDLFESAIKRNSNIKDSGYLMLGRGGILDSIDSLVFASPTLLILFMVFN